MLKISLLSVVCTGMAYAAQAQQKTGYINTDDILARIPAYGAAEQQLLSLRDEWETDLEEMQQEIESLEEAFRTREILYTDEQKAEKKRTIADKKAALQRFRKGKFGSEGDFFQRQQQLLEPIQRDVYDAVRVVAERNEIDFIIDRARTTTLFYADKQWNLNNEVLQELGISLED